MRKKLLIILFLMISINCFSQKFQRPVALTSIGQSAEVQLINIILKKLEIEHFFSRFLEPSSIVEEKTLIISIGGSIKGLSSMGLNTEDEKKRAKELVNYCKEKDIKIIGVHLGGKQRRGDSSDEYLNIVIPHCEYLIVMNNSNYDNFFTKFAKNNNKQLKIIYKLKETEKVINNIF